MTGLLWWFDADDVLTITQSFGLVSQWNDKSGAANHATSGSGFQPTIASDGLKVGRKSLVFAGGTRFDINNGWANQKPFTAVAVVKHTNTAAYRAIIGSPYVGSLEWRISSTHKQSVVKNQVVELGVTTPVVTANATVVLIVTYSAVGLLTCYMDGVSQLSVTNDQAFNASSALAYIGNAFSEPFTGTIGELIKYDHVLDSTELTQVNNYLNTKWK
jgi:hypothetical protein